MRADLERAPSPADEVRVAAVRPSYLQEVEVPATEAAHEGAVTASAVGPCGGAPETGAAPLGRVAIPRLSEGATPRPPTRQTTTP